MTNRIRFTAVAGGLALVLLSACGGSSSSSSGGNQPGTAKYMGGDGIVDDQFFTDSGDSGNGSYATIAAPQPDRLDSAKKFVSDYKAKYNTDPGSYSANAFDGMNVILNAAKQAIVSNGGTLPSNLKGFRESVRKNVASTQLDGAIGKTTFDQNGDTTNVLLTLKVGKSKAWAYSDTVKTSLPSGSASPSGSAAPSGSATPSASLAPSASPTSARRAVRGDISSCTGAVTVASDLPTSGGDASVGKPTQDGAQLAIDQATASKLLGGCTITYIPKDDASVALGKHDPAQGAANISELAANPAVVGVVGPFNSNVALNELPIANRANLTLISPSNTNPGLTIVGSNPDIQTATLKPTGVTTYFRVCTTDIGQGKALAESAYNKLNLRKAYIIDDSETYGKGLADQFSTFFQKLGGTIDKRQHLKGDTKDFKTQITEAQSDGVDLVFFGGTSSNGAGILRKQMVQQGLGTTN